MKQITIDIIQSKPSIDVEIVSKKPQIEVEVKQSRPTISVDVLPPTSIENGDYDVLRNKQSINGVPLVGNKTSEDLGLADEDDVNKLSADFINHIHDYENPHRTTAEQVGAVPKRLANLTYVVVTRPTLSMQHLYVDDNGKDKKISMKQLKEMNTKIVMTNDIAKVDTNKLIVGDIIFETER